MFPFRSRLLTKIKVTLSLIAWMEGWWDVSHGQNTKAASRPLHYNSATDLPAVHTTLRSLATLCWPCFRLKTPGQAKKLKWLEDTQIDTHNHLLRRYSHQHDPPSVRKQLALASVTSVEHGSSVTSVADTVVFAQSCCVTQVIPVRPSTCIPSVRVTWFFRQVSTDWV